MNISSNLLKIAYGGEATAGTSFPFGFKVLEPEDLLVTLSLYGVNTNWVLGTDYTVKGCGSEGTGKIVSMTPITDGNATLTIRRLLPVLQPVQLSTGGPYFPSTLEDECDRLTMICQQ